MSARRGEPADGEDLRGLMGELSRDKALAGIPLFFGSDEKLRVEFLPTGVAPLDKALGGGFAYGRVTELIGEFSSGKTLLAHLAIRTALGRGQDCVYIDVERCYDPAWARTLDIDVDKLIVARPRTGEKAWDLLVALCERGVGVAVLDSIAELLPMDEDEAAMEKSQQGAQARLVGKGFRKLIAANERTAVVLINQLRQKVGIVYGNPEVLPGGRSQGFVAHQLVRVRRGEWIKDGTGEDAKRVGFHLKVKIEKARGPNMLAEGEVPFYFSGLLDEAGALPPLAIDAGIIQKSGAHYTLPDGRKVFGMMKLVEAVREDEALQAELRRQLEEIPDLG